MSRTLVALVLLSSCADPATIPPDGSPSGSDMRLPPGVDGGPLPDGATAPDAQTPDRDAAPPPDLGTPPSSTCRGYATRYWDCCKAHCGWEGNTTNLDGTLASCSVADAPQSSFDQASACDSDAPSAGYTCFSNVPVAVSETLSYGFAAVPAEGDICGRCYRIDFDGTGHYDAADPGSQQLAGHTMIVQATNIGHDVGGGQFDLLIPGGGVGLFNACTRQWGLESDAPLGAQYGGFLTACQAEGGSHDDVRACVRNRCDTVFDEPHLAELRAGCEWFVDWFKAADNPNLDYAEVECPAALVAISGLDRRPLDDIAMCEGGGDGGGDGGDCDCGWAAGGCGDDDGSRCWDVCCGE